MDLTPNFNPECIKINKPGKLWTFFELFCVNSAVMDRSNKFQNSFFRSKVKYKARSCIVKFVLLLGFAREIKLWHVMVQKSIIIKTH